MREGRRSGSAASEETGDACPGTAARVGRGGAEDLGQDVVGGSVHDAADLRDAVAEEVVLPRGIGSGVSAGEG